MKKESQNVIKEVVKLNKDLKDLTVDKINETKSIEPEIQEASFENRCKAEGIPYIKPKRRLSPPLGKLPPQLEKEHKKDWEYVKGIYENLAVPGEAITFSYVKYSGDADYLWEIPANVPVAVPRLIATHLEEVQKYHQFAHRKKANEESERDNFTHNFCVSGTQYRGKFRAIGAFA